jgi:NADPH-dependent ferric siderophore reductase
MNPLVVLHPHRLPVFEHVGPTAHLKVYVPDADGALVARTYTPRRYDPASGTLEVVFVIHGPGPASQWAAQAKPGDRITVAPGAEQALSSKTPPAAL